MNENLPNTDNTETRPKVKVTIEKGESAKTAYEFTDSFSIGRSEKCQVKIMNDTISRFHVEIFYKQERWWIKDLQSSNGTYIDGERIQEKPLSKTTKVELGIDGPLIGLEIEEQEKAEATSLQEKRSMTQIMRKYFIDSVGEKVGEHTMMIRQTFQLIQQKQKRKYTSIIVLIACLCVFAGAFALYKHYQLSMSKKMAAEIFYEMKALEVSLAKKEAEAIKEGDLQKQLEIKSDRVNQQKMQNDYKKLIGKLNVYRKGMKEEDRLILWIASVFGECEVYMPQGFANEVKRYISEWKTTDLYKSAIVRARQHGYVEKVVKTMLDHELPPQFFYLALVESEFDTNSCGGQTYSGIAKGAWQFIPETGRRYNLNPGPKSYKNEPDPLDERHNFDRSTVAAAQYIKDIYSTIAQGSGLLVMASYNWGERKVVALVNRIPIIEEMSGNPKERNFWELLKYHREQIPQQTYDYVFRIFSAAVIGENPQLFGFKFENPLAEAIKKYGG